MEVAALMERALSLHVQGEFEQAKQVYDYVLFLQPEHFDALHLSGVIAVQNNNPELAVNLLDKAIKVNPNNAAAYSNRGVAFKNLNRLEEAVLNYDKAIKISPDYAEAFCNRGSALQALGRTEDAIENYNMAVKFKSGYVEAYYNRGNAFQKLMRIEDALDSYNRAVELAPNFAEAYYNRGNALLELMRLDEAIGSYSRAVEIAPNFADAYWSMAYALLLTGDMSKGFELYEWRWRRDAFTSPKRDFSQPLWLGNENLHNKTILLHAEQGLGDTLQFCRYAKLVKDRGGRVILEAPDVLASLLANLKGVDEFVATGKVLPPFDYHCPLLSLPHAFKTNLNKIPDSGRYLVVADEKIRKWSSRLGIKSKCRVGLVWSGSTVHKNDLHRSLRLEQILPYLPSSCEYISLQKEVREVDKRDLAQSSIRHYGEELIDFADTGALCELVDVIVGVDTSTVHLAGALGKSAWVLLPYVPDWRWLLNRDRSPWYDSLRLYRQGSDRSWLAVLERVSKDLSALADA